MSADRQTSAEQAHQTKRAARRRFLKVAATGVVAAPVIESITGKQLLTVSAQAQTVSGQGIDGAFTGTLDS